MARHTRTGLSLRAPHVAEEFRLYCHRRSYTGARHRRQYHCAQLDQRYLAEPDSRSRSNERPCHRHARRSFRTLALQFNGPVLQTRSTSWNCAPSLTATQLTKISPKAPHAITFEGYFITDDRHIFILGLSNEHSVKWILVRARQKSGANTMLCGNG